MNFDFIEQLRVTLESGEVFGWKFLMAGCKALALALLLFRIIETYIKQIDNEGPKFGNIFSIFGYAFFIMSCDWIIDSIEQTFGFIDSQIYNTPSNLYTDLLHSITNHADEVYEDVGFLEMVAMPIDLIMSAFYGLFLGILVSLIKLADLAVTAGFLLSRLFLIQLMKLLFPFVIALSTLEITKDLLGKWIKRYIGLFLLGLAYIGIIKFCAVLQDVLLLQFQSHPEPDVLGMGNYIFGACVTVIVVFTFKVKMFTTVTSYLSNFFS